MNRRKKLIILTACWLILSATAVSAGGGQQKRRPRGPTRKPAARPATDTLLELVRQAQRSADEAQAEARRAREQGETLQRRLEQSSQELAVLRQELNRLGREATTPAIADCGLRNAELKAETSDQPSSVQSLPAGNAQPEAPNPQSAIRNPQSEERLAKLEEQVEINTAQIKEQAQTKVESDSRFKVRLYGMVLVNTYFNTDGLQRAAPLFALPPRAAPIGPRHSFGTTLRQTVIGLAMEGPRLGEARLSANAEFDFFGGTIATTYGDVLGALRLRVASARIDWPQTSLVIGQTAPLISPLNPTSLAAVWFPALTGAGNLWQWRPQISLERRVKLSEPSELIWQGGVMMPFGETVNSVPLGGEPGYESRVAFRRKTDPEHRLEVGLGGYFGRRSFSFGRRVDAYAVTGDWLIPIRDRVELSGELYYGRSISFGEISGGRIDRIFAFSGAVEDPATRIRGIHAAGGWAQLSLQARRDLEVNLAYGQEDPRNRDLLSGLINNATRFKNQVASANFIYQLRPNFHVSLEYRRLWTDYAAGRRRQGHVNLAVGYIF